MADSSLFDNSTTTQRLITATTSSTQTFSNTATDTSYSLDALDTQDFFRLRLSQRSSVVLTLTSQNANANIAVLDAGGILQESTNGGTLTDAVTTGSLAAGDYYIRVSLADSSTSTNYSLKVNTTNASRADLIWRNSSSGQNAIWLMNGGSIVSSFYTTTVADVNWKIQATADFNGDGTPDYIWRNYSTGQNAVWLMNADSTFRSSAYFTTVGDLNWRIEGAGDFDGDGKNDLVWRNYATGDNAYWLMDGITFKTTGYLAKVSDVNARIDAIGDLNGDGKADLVWRNYQTGQNSIWLMNGLSLTSVVSFLAITDINWNIVGVGDANGDGKQDIAWRNNVNGQSAFWLMNGTTYSSTNVALPIIADPNWQISAVITGQPPSMLAGSSMGTAFNIGILNNTGSYGDSIGSVTSSNGYYKFNLSTASVLNLSLTGLNVGTNADLQVVKDTDGNGVISSQSEIIVSSVNLDNADELISNLSLAAGTYFIRVFSSSTQLSTYSLGVSSATEKQIDLAPPSSTFTITQTNGSALPATVSLKSGNSNYLSSVLVNYSIRNTSAGNVTPSVFKVSFYLSRDNVITSTDLLLGTIDPNTGNSDKDVFVTNLAPGATWTRQQTLNMVAQADSWWGGDQNYYIGMIIDSGNQIAESNELNNTASAAIAIRDTLQPDLLGGGLTITQSTLAPNQAISFTGVIKNIGNKVAGSTRALVKFYFSNDDILDGSDTVIATANIAPVAAQGNVSFSTAIGPPASGSPLPAAFFTTPTTNILTPDSAWEGWRGNGRYYICMYVDFFDAAVEGYSKENNLNYGRVLGQYTDYDFIDITGAPNNTPV